MTNFTEINRKHWDDLASIYDAKPWIKDMTRRLSDELRSHLGFIGLPFLDPDAAEDDAQPPRQIKVLDYACGPGVISEALAPYVTRLMGVDVSVKMVSSYNARADNQGLSPTFMSATVGDLLSPTPSPSIAGPEFYDFDLAAVGLGFHHFEDPDLAARRLVQRLKPGTGVLLITDFLPYAPTGASTHAHHHEGHGDDPGTKGVEHTVAHHGFARERIEHMFQKAGCVDVRFEVLAEGFSFGDGGNRMDRTVFKCRGTRKEMSVTAASALSGSSREPCNKLRG